MREIIQKYCSELIIALSLLGFASGPTSHCIEVYKLDKTRYIAKVGNSIGTSYYGYDDDNDGSIDRIEETGIVPGARIINVPVRRTFLEEDKIFYEYYLRYFKVNKVSK